MRRPLLLIMLFTVVTVVSAAQMPVPAPQPGMKPQPLPPGMPGIQPAAATAPVLGGMAEVPLARFEPLTAWPPPAQQAVRSALLGSAWLTRMSLPHGRFQYGYLPALRQPMDGDHEFHQALAAWALSQAAKFAGDDRQAAVASQAVLTLLAATRVDPTDPGVREPLGQSFGRDGLGFAAVLALAIYDLPGADEKLIGEAERLCQYLRRKHLRNDGPVLSPPGLNGMGDWLKVHPNHAGEHPGYVLHALAVSNRMKPADWKAIALRKGCEFYRAGFRAHPHPLLAAALTPAFTEVFLQTKSTDAAAAVFELNDWLVNLQYPPADPRNPAWVGGFRPWADGKPVDGVPGSECGAYLVSLSCACQVARHVPDLTRYPRYRQAAIDTLTFLAGIQYGEGNTRHFENAFRANTLIGGFYMTAVDGNLRVDATAWGVLGMLRFLGSGAER